METPFKEPPIQGFSYSFWKEKGLEISVLREDLVHPFISGNKWRKLKYNLIDLENSGKKTVLTFGGVYSNHLVATSAAAIENKFDAIGIVRGENVENEYLDFMRSNGMKLHFISRQSYREKNKEEFISDLLRELLEKNWINNINDVFVLPEGGSNLAAVKGASEIMDGIPEDTDIIICPCGTGGTIAGISKKLLPHQHLIGISVLKVNDVFEKEIARFGGKTEQVTINYDYHFGGYAKRNKTLLDFCEDFISQTNIPIEPVYTGKMFYAIDDLIKKNYFKRGAKVTLIHTGGIFNFTRGLEKSNSLSTIN